MVLRVLACLLCAALLAGCASAPQAADVQLIVHACDVERDAGACRQLALLLLSGEMPREAAHDAEHAILKGCWSDRLVDPRQGRDVRWRLCYEAGKHFTARQEQAMEAPDTQLRRVAANLYLRACELGQPQACRLLLHECLVLEGEPCVSLPDDEQAQRWADQRRERDARELTR